MHAFLRLGGRWIFVRAAGLGLGIWLLGGLVADAATVSDITDRAIVAGGTTGPVNFTLSNFDPKQTIRTVAANITSGNGQAYEAEGTRILQGLKPDVVMIQEFNVSSNSSTDLRNWVTSTFGSEFSYFRENYTGIPNGVISRWPIVASGSWDDGDDAVGNRGFAWARIDIPGDKNLWVISFHLKASSGSSNINRRSAQAQVLVELIQANVPADDYLMIGGDANTYDYSEACLVTLGGIVDVSAPRPVDQTGDPDTNFGRYSPYDWVLAEPELDALETPLQIGSLSFPNGLVFDSRVFSPLSSVSPVLSADSGVTGMQHMAVVRAFAVPAAEMLTVSASSSNPALVPNANIVVSGSGVSRTVTVTPAANQTGTATITVTGGDGVSTASDTFVVTVNPVTPVGSTFAGAYPGKIMTDIAPNGLSYLANYGFGGSEGIAPTLPTMDSGDPAKLKLIVVFRTDDLIVLGGETTMDLVSGWSTSGVSVDPSTDASPVPANTVRKVISVDRGSGSRRFLRATITR